MARRDVTLDEAREMGEKLGITWDEFDLEEFRRGMVVELEHGLRDPVTNVTDDDLLMTAKIALRPTGLREGQNIRSGERPRMRNIYQPFTCKN